MTVSIWERVYTALTPLGIPMAETVFLLGDGGEYPPIYLVYRLIVGQGLEYADNKEVSHEHLVQISIFCRDGLSALPDVTGKMIAAGFTAGPERELAWGERTGYFGIAKDFYLLEVL